MQVNSTLVGHLNLKPIGTISVIISVSHTSLLCGLSIYKRSLVPTIVRLRVIFVHIGIKHILQSICTIVSVSVLSQIVCTRGKIWNSKYYSGILIETIHILIAAIHHVGTVVVKHIYVKRSQTECGLRTHT